MTIQSIKVGLVGLGFIGKVHAHAYQSIAHCFSNPQVAAELVAVLRSSTGRDGALLQSLGNPLETTEPDQFYQAGPDMVDICTPNNLHLEEVEEAVRHGVHLYCEKPLGLNLQHARKIAEMAARAGILTHTALVLRYSPAVYQSKAIIAAGLLGEIYNFRGLIFHNSYMDASRPISWRLRNDQSGGGALADLGIHILDLTRYLIGEVAWVNCQTRTLISQRLKEAGSSQMVPVDVDDWAHCTLGLANGPVGVVETTRMSGGAGSSTQMEIFGSQGSIHIDMKNPYNAIFYDHRKQQHTFGNLNLPAPEGIRPIASIYPPAKMSLGAGQDAHLASIYDFLIHIKEGTQSFLDFDEGLKAQEILEAAYISASRDGEKITLPLG